MQSLSSQGTDLSLGAVSLENEDKGKKGTEIRKHLVRQEVCEEGRKEPSPRGNAAFLGGTGI